MSEASAALGLPDATDAVVELIVEAAAAGPNRRSNAA
jgi:hypothetical protein